MPVGWELQEQGSCLGWEAELLCTVKPQPRRAPSLQRVPGLWCHPALPFLQGLPAPGLREPLRRVGTATDEFIPGGLHHWRLFCQAAVSSAGFSASPFSS